jgi:hypothetical protein
MQLAGQFRVSVLSADIEDGGSVPASPEVFEQVLESLGWIAPEPFAYAAPPAPFVCARSSALNSGSSPGRSMKS